MFTSTLCPPIHNLIANIKTTVTVYAGENPGSLSFSWINTPGVMIFIAAIIGGLIQGASFGTMGKVLVETLKNTGRRFLQSAVLWQQQRLWDTAE